MEVRNDLLALREGEPAFPSLPACAVGDEMRPAIGCLFPVQLGVEAGLRPEDGEIRRRYRLPAGVVGAATVLVQPSVRRSEREGWLALPPQAVHDPGTAVDVRFRPPPGAAEGPLTVSARVSALPPAEQSVHTTPVKIARGAVLAAGLGLVPAVRAVGGPPVEARLVARTARGDRELLRAVLDPASPETAEWREHRIPLDALEGESARFVFSSRAAGVGLVAPLWGAPRILEPRPRADARNLILVSLDTLRADFVGAYGSTLPTTPSLDRLAAEGALFTHVWTTYPSTPASHMSLMTGLHPNAHGVIGPAHPLPADVPTLAQLLAARGWQTGAVTENGMLVAGAGFQRGFAYYRENKGASVWDASGQVDVTVGHGIRWLEAHRDEKFFLFLHTYQVHEPYSPPPAFDRFRTYEEKGRRVEITAATPAAIRDRHAYAGETLYTDHEVGRLLDAVATLGLADRTVVVVTSDHGEEFGEHGWKSHGRTLYEEVLRVPLILRAPGRVPAGVRVAQLASLVDVAPTLLELLGVPAPPEMHGQSLVGSLARPDAQSARAVFAELVEPGKGRRSVAARTATHKWIWHEPPTRPAEVYDLAADPGERRNVATPERLAEGEPHRRRYEELGRARSLAGPRPTPPPLDPDTERKLRALGYVE
jgi:arylsulfatase A-like enzyme